MRWRLECLSSVGCAKPVLRGTGSGVRSYIPLKPAILVRNGRIAETYHAKAPRRTYAAMPADPLMKDPEAVKNCIRKRVRLSRVCNHGLCGLLATNLDEQFRLTSEQNQIAFRMETILALALFKMKMGWEERQFGQIEENFEAYKRHVCLLRKGGFIRVITQHDRDAVPEP